MRDMKMQIQEEAEDIANEEYGAEFYSLSKSQRTAIYNKAMSRWIEKQAEINDIIRDRIKEGDI